MCCNLSCFLFCFLKIYQSSKTYWIQQNRCIISPFFSIRLKISPGISILNSYVPPNPFFFFFVSRRLIIVCSALYYSPCLQKSLTICVFLSRIFPPGWHLNLEFRYVTELHCEPDCDCGHKFLFSGRLPLKCSSVSK